MDFEKLSKKKLPSWLVYGVTITFIIYAFYSVYQKENELKIYGIETNAIITYYRWGNKAIKDVEFQYKVNGQLITGYGQVSSLPCDRKKNENCIGTQIRIIYSSKNPKVSELILE